jgi:predicted amidophosphoribosyltransferase
MTNGWLRAFIDLIFPPKEDARRAESLTREELEALFHPRLAKEAWIISLFPYTHPSVRALIRGVKFYDVRKPLSIVGEIAGEYLIETIADKKTFSGWDTPLLVPMPSSKKRFRERGYNQAERIALSIYELLPGSVIYAPEVLAREERESQTRVARSKRLENTVGAFFLPNPEKVSGKHIILVDDVVESAGTMKDARRALLKAGAADVFGVAIAH